MVAIYDGKYGPYVKWEKVNATIPKEVEVDQVTLEMALELIVEREAKSGKKRKAPAKKAAAKKPAAKKPAAKKKAAPKKAAAKKKTDD